MTQNTLAAPAALEKTPTARGNWLVQTARLAGWLLYATRRRVMSKVLGGILIGLFALVVCFLLLGYFQVANSSATSGCVPPPSVATQQAGQPSSGGPPPCEGPSQAQLDAQRQAAADSVRDAFTFPGSLAVGGGFLTLIGLIVVVVAAGTIVGGEYGHSTVRVQLARGVGRGQFIAAQGGALAVLALITAGFVLALATVEGLVLGPLLGATLPAFPFGGVLEILSYWLALSLTLFCYAAIALLFATLARSTAAGIAFGLGYFVAEIVLTGILALISTAFDLAQPQTAEFIRHIPDWFLTSNVSYISRNLSESPLAISSAPGGGEPFGMAHAVLVTLLYLALTIGGSYLLTRKRDITD